MNKLILTLFCSFSIALAFTQTKSEIIQQRIELISEQLETEELDLTNVIEQLNYYYDNKINLNNTDFETLEELGLLTEVQMNDVFLHIKQFGKFLTIYELQALRYWDLQTIQNVLPFVKVDDKLDQLHVSLAEALKYGRFEVFLRYQRVPEKKAGYEYASDSLKEVSNSYYLGNADHYYTRVRYTYRTNLSVGITADKDPGEQFFKGTQKNGFDFYSAHAFYKGGKYIKAVALGDYQIQIGQALNLWSGYAFGKTADVTNIKKNAQALRPYSSVDENRFMRGAAIDMAYKDLGLTLFASMKKVDASIIEDSLADDLEFASSIDLSGFHRTTSQVNKKDLLTERIVGGNLNYKIKSLTVGVAAIGQSYNKDYSKAIQPYNQFDFRGKSMMSLSADYSYVWRNVNLFGEVSRSSYSKDHAFLQGLIISLDSKASLSVLYRNYGKAYQTFYNNGFAEGSNTQNESGLYLGFRTKLASAWTANTYIDFFKAPWLKYLVEAPTTGYEFLNQISYKPNKVMEVYGRFRQQLRQKNSRDVFGAVTQVEDVIQRNFRLNFSYQVTEALQIKSRIEYVTINRPSNTPEQGMIFTQDLLIKSKSSHFDVALRYALFDTDSYDTRLYTFEANALNVFSVPAYYYQGSRGYITLRYSFLRKCDLWVKYGTYIYSNRTNLSSGAEAINGNRKSDITVQFRVAF
ncbi:MAG: hypothetical protein V4622_11150 [Bacteroidota bacterium]